MDVFSFRQFAIHQESCGMKVGTDGVLLGAWAHGGLRILDVGTGTGLIALMMAQRFPNAGITAIDIDHDACCQARQNVSSSMFGNRIAVVESSIQDYAESHNGKFDSIVSNPPFFMDSLKNPDAKRSMARHTDTLSYADLFHHAAMLLSDNGVFSVIIPADNVESFISESYIVGLSLCNKTAVRTVGGKPAKRYLLSFSKKRPDNVDIQDITLLEADGTRSEWYRKLTEDFYLK